MTSIKRLGRVLLLASALIGTPELAQAQSTPAVPTATAQLPRLIGRTVKIVYRDGRVMISQVKKQDAETITVGGMPPDPFSDILTIDVVDRIIDGGVMGAIAGAAWGVADTHGHSTAVPIARGALGGLIGAIIDYIIPDCERITINQPKELTMVPTATLHSIGVSGRVVW